LWSNSASLVVGRDGIGTLNVYAGGKVSNTHGSLGLNSEGTGTATIHGAGSEWNNSSQLYIGASGAGIMYIEAGGEVTNTEGLIGAYDGAHGSATVTGIGSLWSNSISLRIGGASEIGGGIGLLTLNDSGVVSAPEITIWSTGTVTGNGGMLVGDVINYGTIAPGNSPGLLSIDGNLTQAGILEIELGGLLASSEYDQLAVDGNVLLGGTLDVGLINSFSLAPSQSFSILTATGSLSGMFSGLPHGSLVGNFGGTDLFINYDTTGGIVSLYTIPEPSSLLLAGFGLLALLSAARRRWDRSIAVEVPA
jgi:T5SS/PEP-CTERM-associated repeat protein